MTASQEFRTLERMLGVVAISVILLTAAACSGEGSTTGSTGVEFGSGALPATVPEGFPIPESAVIGSTLVDWDNGRTEVIMRIPAEPAAVILFYGQNLERAGYTVVTSEGDTTMRAIVFTGNDIEGDLDIDLVGQQLTQAVLIFTHD